MSVTQRLLKQIIREEVVKAMNGSSPAGRRPGSMAEGGNPNKPWDAFFPPASDGHGPEGATGGPKTHADRAIDSFKMDLEEAMAALRQLGSGTGNLTDENLDTVKGLLDSLYSNMSKYTSGEALTEDEAFPTSKTPPRRG